MLSPRKWDGMVIVTNCPKCSIAAFCLDCSRYRAQADKQQEHRVARLELIYDAEIGAYRIPSIVDRSAFTVLNAYCEIKKHD